MSDLKQKFVIDRYYNGINGWTYAETYTDIKTLQDTFGNALFNLNGDDEDLFLKRNQLEDERPAEYIRYSEWA